MAHIVWDWNGTLFDDQAVTLTALHAVLDWAGLPPVDAEEYKRLYVRPVRLFYERLFGREIPDREWQLLDDIWHRAYDEAVDVAQLTIGARSVLAALEEDGHTQSLLSMYRHETLLELVEKFGITRRFLRVEGLQGEGGGRKAPHLKRHLEGLVPTVRMPQEAMLVGDAIDDADAALTIGCRCVLYDGGSHLHEELMDAGAPVIDDLSAVVPLAKGFG